MPGVSAVIDPEPSPARDTFRRAPSFAKVTVTSMSPSTGKLHWATVLVHSPVQPTRRELVSGAAFRRTIVPAGSVAVHVVPQLSGPSLVTVPPPSPAFSIVTVKVLRANVAVTFLMPVTVTVQDVPVPEHEPPQLVNVDVASGSAFSVTFAPAL